MNNASQSIQPYLEQVIAAGRETGLQVAAYVNGELVIDAWAGTLDGLTPVNGDTLFPIFSVTKGWASTVIHRLVDRGLLEYDRPLADYWPEFAANGKGGITMRHALGHTAGLQHMPVGLAMEDLADWDKMCRAMAAATPTSLPGEVRAYHAVTFGWLLGEPARRVTGKPFEQLLREEIAEPLGGADLYLALPAALDSRVAILEEVFAADRVFPPKDDPTPREIPAYMLPLHEWMNQPDARRACLPASSGIGSGRAIAHHYAALIAGGVNGVQLLSDERLAIACKPDGPDDSRGLGYGLGYPTAAWSTRKSAFGHDGYGGATAFADPEQRFALAITKNRFSATGAHVDIMKKVRQILNLPA